MTGTVMFDLQAAVMAAAAGAGQAIPDTGEIPEGGSFSDILAAHTAEGTAEQAVTGTAENEVPEEDVRLAAENSMDEMMKIIDNADDGIRKAINMLLKAVVNAMRGSNDGRERKTDLFMILADGSSDILDGEMSNEMFVASELLNDAGFMLKNSFISVSAGTAFAETDKLDTLIGELFGIKKDDDFDEDTMAETLAAMLNIPPEAIENFSLIPAEAKEEAVKKISEIFEAPKQAIAEAMPEKLPEAEKLYSDFKAVVVKAAEGNGNAPETDVKVSFAALKINNAAEQVDSIGSRHTETVVTAGSPEMTETAEVPETSEVLEPSVTAAPVMTETPAAETAVKETPEEDSSSDTASEAKTEEIPNADAAAVNAAPVRTVFTERTEIRETELDTDTKVSVENQVTETLNEEIRSMPDNDGKKELVLILRPKELGQIAVRLVKENGAVSVTLSAQYEQVGKLMTERAAALGNSLAGQDHEIRDVSIVEPSSAAEQMGLNFTDRGFGFTGNSQQDRNYSGGNSYGDVDAVDGLTVTNAEGGEIIFREARLWTTA